MPAASFICGASSRWARSNLRCQAADDFPFLRTISVTMVVSRELVSAEPIPLRSTLTRLGYKLDG